MSIEHLKCMFFLRPIWRIFLFLNTGNFKNRTFRTSPVVQRFRRHTSPARGAGSVTSQGRSHMLHGAAETILDIHDLKSPWTPERIYQGYKILWVSWQIQWHTYTGVSPPDTSHSNPKLKQGHKQTLLQPGHRPHVQRQEDSAMLGSFKSAFQAPHHPTHHPHHVVWSWPPMFLRDVTWAAKPSEGNWQKLVRFFKLRGHSIQAVWRLLPFRARRRCLGKGVWPEAHSGCITWINISMSHGCHWRKQLRFGRASAKEPSPQCQLSCWGPSCTLIQFPWSEQKETQDGIYPGSLTKPAQLAPLA